MSVGVGDVVLGRWRIMARLGGGGMGDVWRIEDIDSPINCALKTIKGQMTAEDRKRFEREAIVMSHIHHERAVGLHQVGLLDDGTPCIVMDLVDGESLENRLQRQGPQPWRYAIAVVTDTLEALSAAHQINIVHRDIKPANILVERQEPHRCRLADFGIARALDTSVGKITATGVIAGTVDYMSPEHLQGRELSGRTDIYALGLVLWEMLEGRLPFPEHTGVTRALQRCDPPPPSLPAMSAPPPASLNGALFAMLDRQPNRRPDAQECLALLRTVLTDSSEHVAHQNTQVLGSVSAHLQTAKRVLPDVESQTGTERAVPISSDSVGSQLFVAKLPPSRIAMPAERRWLSTLVQPALAYSIGPYWFAVIDAHLLASVGERITLRYGASIPLWSEALTEPFAMTGAAALGGGALPAPLTRAMADLSRR
jgi:serine/threonine protein kinase